ncbi:MAG: TonB-dependent receptor [Candidatus Kapabacteria bacterium]|nr:TonB-dependent receptor [Candidatus Kapabacteria bacterium]
MMPRRCGVVLHQIAMHDHQRLVCALIALLLAVTIAAADTHIHGIVRDSATRQPLAGATVIVEGTSLGAVAARDGVFHLHDVPAGRLRLVVSYVYYVPRTIDVVANDDVRIEVLLSQQLAPMREVVVQGVRRQSATPTQDVVMLTQAEVDEHRGQTFADVLRQVPGITVMQTGPSIAKPMLHGMTGTRLVTLNAGIAQEGQQWGAEHAPEIDPFTPDRIGVVRGPAAVLHGPNSMGGVISVEPRPLTTSTSWMGDVMLQGFMNNRQGAGSIVAERGGLFGTPLSIRMQASGRRAGDARTPDYVLRNSGFAEAAGAVDLGLRLGQWSLTSHARGFATTLGIYEGSHLGNPADLQRAIERGGPATTSAFSYDIGRPRQEISHRLLSVQATGPVSDADRLRFVYGWQQNLRQEFDKHNARIVGRGDDLVERARDSIERLSRALATPAMELLLTTYTADLRWERTILDAWQSQTGISGTRQVNDRSGSVFLVPDYLAHGVGAYTLQTLMMGDLMLSGGLRYDVRWLTADITRRGSRDTVQQNRTFANLAGSIGAAWNATQDVRLSVNVGTGWRPPQVNELYANDVHHGVALYEVGDSTLRPERNLAIDAGVDVSVRGLDLQVTAYMHDLDGYIYAVPEPGNPTVTVRGAFPTYRFIQHDAVIGGIDMKATWAVSETWSVLGTLAVVRGQDVERDVPLFMMPADRGRIAVHAHLPDVLGLHDAFVEAGCTGVRRQDRFVSGEDYVDPPAGYALLDLAAGGTIHLGSTDIRLSCTVSNLLDQRYRDYLSRFRYVALDSGRDIVLRLAIPLNH